MNHKKFKFWKKVRDWCNKRMKSAWFEGGNCSSCCPQCKRWEHEGNPITTQPWEPDDGTEKRECQTCGCTWKAVFTPAGFMPIDNNTDF